MRDELFQELLENAKQAGAWLRGEDVEPSRIIFVGQPDPRAIRTRAGMTQEAFAAALGISVKTLRDWELGRRTPSGPALGRLQQAEKDPAKFGDVAA
jgi:putative transcriptional regulator